MYFQSSCHPFCISFSFFFNANFSPKYLFDYKSVYLTSSHETCLAPNQNIFTQKDIFILAQVNDISEQYESVFFNLTRFFHLFPLSLIPRQQTHSLSHQCLYLSSLFLNCIQKATMFACLSWDVGFKKTRLVILLVSDKNQTKSYLLRPVFHNLYCFEGYSAQVNILGIPIKDKTYSWRALYAMVKLQAYFF